VFPFVIIFCIVTITFVLVVSVRFGSVHIYILINVQYTITKSVAGGDEVEEGVVVYEIIEGHTVHTRKIIRRRMEKLFDQKKGFTDNVNVNVTYIDR